MGNRYSDLDHPISQNPLAHQGTSENDDPDSLTNIEKSPLNIELNDIKTSKDEEEPLVEEEDQHTKYLICDNLNHVYYSKYFDNLTDAREFVRRKTAEICRTLMSEGTVFSVFSDPPKSDDYFKIEIWSRSCTTLWTYNTPHLNLSIVNVELWRNDTEEEDIELNDNKQPKSDDN